MKKLICFAAVLFSVFFGFCNEGIFTGEKNIKVVQSKWFDIIYPESCLESAEILYNEADGIYMDLAEMYGWEEPPCRMPVVLTSAVETFNAYYSNGYYNHIVLYVTSPSQEVNNQPDILTATFKHELTHAFTYNMKSEEIKNIGKIFSDSASLALLTVTPGMAEGATLTSESFEGNGRLNDEFTKQMVKQAKIEGKFPAFSDVQGSRDIFPTGSFYFFNGAFHEYLQEKYGMEKYAQWWYRCVNSSLFISDAFFKTYGAKLNEEWQRFSFAYKIPDVEANPVLAGEAQDFFEEEKNNYSELNDNGARYTSLSLSEKGLSFIDAYNRGLYFVSSEEFGRDKIKPVLLDQLMYIESAFQSRDGKYIAVSYYDGKKGVTQYHTGIYDTENKNWFIIPEHGLKSAAIVQKNEEYYLICLKLAGVKSQCRISRLIISDKGKIKGDDVTGIIDFERNQIPESFVDVARGTAEGDFAYILKDKMVYSVQTADLQGNVLCNFRLPAENDFLDYKMHYLSAVIENPDELLFSWVCRDSMPRVGKLNIAEGKFSFYTKDLSGGIYYPLFCESLDLIYCGQFYEQNRLFKNQEIFYGNGVSYAAEKNINDKNTNTDAVTYSYKPDENFEKNSKKYNPLKYMTKGLWIPFTSLASVSYDSDHQNMNGTPVSFGLPFGISYRTNDPADEHNIEISAGYGLYTNSWAFGLDYTGGTDTSLFKYDLSGMVEFDVKGWKAADLRLSVSSLIDFGRYSSFIISPSEFCHIGRSNNVDGCTDYVIRYGENDFSFASLVQFRQNESINPDLYFYNRFGATLYYDNVRTTGHSRYEKKGIKAGFAPFYYLSYGISGKKIDYSYGDVSLFSVFYIPRIIPVECKAGYTYNLPAKIVLSAFHTNAVSGSLIGLYKYPAFVFAGGEIILFGHEIQKAVPYFSFLFINDIRISIAGVMGYGYPDNQSAQGLGFLNAGSIMKKIFDKTNKMQSALSLKFTAGYNLFNLGGAASYEYKNYISLALNVCFDSENIKPELTLESEIRF